MGGRGRGLALAVAMAYGGCTGMEERGVEAPPRAERPQGQVGAQGIHLNGIHLNGTHLNGPGPGGEGQVLEAVLYAGAWQPQGPGEERLPEDRDPPRRRRRLEAVRLEGGALTGRQGGRRLTAPDFTGVHFWGRLEDRSQVELRVEGVERAHGHTGELWLYQVSWRAWPGAEWRPLCKDSQGWPLAALALPGRWDYRLGVPGQGGAWHEDEQAFTLACEGSALAKCMRMGYQPSATVGGRSLRAYHQACTRLVRADFCGDGNSYTQGGQWVNLYDRLGVQQDEVEWAAEAEWDEGGARCLSSPARARVPVVCVGREPLPPCGAQGPGAGALLRSEVQPQP
jgi:hypothetical protein